MLLESFFTLEVAAAVVAGNFGTFASVATTNLPRKFGRAGGQVRAELGLLVCLDRADGG